MNIKTKLHNIQNTFFNIFIFISYTLIFVSTIGFSQIAPKYISNLDYYLKIYVCLFLIWRFNPLRSNIEFTDLDRKIAFNAGCLILTTTALNNYIEQIKNIVKIYIL